MAAAHGFQGTHRATRWRMAAAAFVATVLAAGPALPQSAPAAEGSALAESAEGGEIQRFCSNIADAARDRRYALQAQELEELRQEVDERIVALEDKRAEYEAWLQRRDDFLARAEDNIVSIYSSMRPDAAAEGLAEVRIELAAAILMKLEPRVAGVILNEMKSKAAARLTGIMASAVNKEDPS